VKSKLSKMGWKSKLFLTWVAIEIAVLPISIPATAQIVERIAFSMPAHVSSVELNMEPGLSRYFVVSNAPFSVISTDAIGQFDIDITVTGTVNGVHFGQKAQKPGPLQTCSTISSSLPTIIYTGDQKTAAKRGKVIEQAIVVDIRYDPTLEPAISFEPGTNKIVAITPSAQNCQSKNS